MLLPLDFFGVTGHLLTQFACWPVRWLVSRLVWAGWCWFIVREKHCWLVDFSWLKPTSEQGAKLRSDQSTTVVPNDSSAQQIISIRAYQPMIHSTNSWPKSILFFYPSSVVEIELEGLAIARQGCCTCNGQLSVEAPCLSSQKSPRITHKTQL